MSGEAAVPLTPGQRRLRAVPLDVPGVRLLAELGRGARSVVYRVECEGHEYALKTLAELTDGGQAPTFTREAALLASLDHPGLVRIYEVGDSGGWPYILMDLVEGRSLDRVLASEELDDLTVAKIGASAADALATAHAAGLVHRDVKPANIIVEPDGAVRLIDFGLATRFGGESGGVAAGTFLYSAPEQTGMLHRAVDGRADLYALGVVLYECLVGATPFEATDSGELIRMHLTTSAPDVRTLRPGVVPALAAVVRRLLAKDPDDRYQTALALRADLTRIVTGEREFPLAGGVRPIGARPRPIIGREREIAALTAKWERTLAGRGGAVLVEGAAGAGKTRLVFELAHAVTARGRLVLYGKGSSDDPVPLGPVRAAVERYLRELGDLPAARLTPAIEGVRAAAGDAVNLLAQYFPLLAGLLEVEASDETAGLGGNTGDIERTFGEAVADFLVGLADQHGGAVLHLEDLQWWDEATRRVVRNLGDVLHSSKLLLVATGRDDAESAPAVEAFKADLGDALDVMLPVGPLADQAVSTLVASLLGARSLPRELVARLAAHAGGNPLAVSEYVRAALDAGMLRPVRGAWALDEAGLEKLSLPEGTVELLLRRVDALGEEACRVLTVAAAIGNTFQVDLVASVIANDPLASRPNRSDAGPRDAPGAPVSERDAPSAQNGMVGASGGADAAWMATTSAVVDAARHRLVEPTGRGYVFFHDRIREALLADLDEAGLRRLHQAIAEALERRGLEDAAVVYAVASHYLRGETDRTPDRVYHAALVAGMRALTEHAAVDAFDLLTRAETSARVAGITPPARFHAALGTAALRTGRPDVAKDHLHRALELEREPLRRAALRARIADAYHLRWQGILSMEEARAGLAEIGSGIPRNPLGLWISTIGLLVGARLLRLLPARLRFVTGECRERHRLRNELTGLMAQAAAITMRIPLMIALTLRSSYSAARLGDGAQFALHHAARAMVSGGAGRAASAAREIAVSLATAEASGDPQLLAQVNCMAAVALDIMSPTTVTSGQRTKWTLERHGKWLGHGDFLSSADNLGCILLMRGYVEEATMWYQRGRQRAVRDDALGNEYAAFGARVAALSGRTAESVARLRRARDFAATTPDDVSGRLAVAVASTHVVAEQGEFGQPFEDALAEFRAMGKGPRQVWSSQRMFWVYQAFGRLAQAEAALGDGSARPEPAQLARAKRAVRELRKVANGPVLRAYATAASARLDVISGNPMRALRLLGSADGAEGGIDAPLVDYEVARVRAKAYLALGRDSDARIHAKLAAALAIEHGWRVRLRWVRAEFGIEATSVTGSRDPKVVVTSTPSGPEEHWAAEVYGRRLRALHQVSLAAASVLDTEQLSRVALDEVVRIFGADRAFLFLVGSGTERVEPYLGRDSRGADLNHLADYGSSLVERVRENQRALVVTGSEEGAALGSQSALVHGLRSIMIAPMIIKGQLLGVVYLDSRAAKGVFTPDDVDILRAITNQVGVAITTARTAQLEVEVHSAKRERDVANMLREAMNDIAGSLDPDEVGRRIVAAVGRAMRLDRGAVIYHDNDGILVAVTNDGQPSPVAAADPVIIDLIESRAPRRGVAAPRELGALFDLLGSATRAWLAVPLVIRGEHRGMLVVGNASETLYTDRETEIAQALAGQGMTAYENAVLFRRIEELAVRDGLTGLFNRRHFFDVLRHRFHDRRRVKRPVAAVMVDIDHFKNVNDTHGHAVGDDVIREVAERLRRCLRSDDVICRYGGEEFAIMLDEASASQAEVVAERLRTAIERYPVPSADGPLRITVSVGLASAVRGDSDLHTLLDLADDALYSAKRAGRNRVAGGQVEARGH